MTLAGAAIAKPTASGCDNAPLPNKPTITVLVMGDSLTQEFDGDYTWRYRFWQAERAKGVNIDFVGPFTALMATWVPPGSAYRTGDYGDPCFNQQHHFATGGKEMAATLEPAASDPNQSEVAAATSLYHPDVVVDFMGYNDLKAAAQNGQDGTNQLLATVKAFIAQVRTVSSTTPVAVANVLSTKPPQIAVDATSYNTLLKADLADPMFAAGPVGLIDLTKDWKTAPVDTWDGYHPNANGEMHLAWDVADGLNGLGFGTALARPIPVVALGPPEPGSVAVSGTASSLHVTWTFPTGADTEILYDRDLTAGTGWVQVDDERWSTAYTATGLTRHRYEFRVQAAKGSAVAAGVYSPSVIRDFRSIPKITVSPVRGHRVRVAWTRQPDATRYQVLIRSRGGAWHTMGWTTGTTLISGRLVAKRHYAVAVVAWDSYGAGRRSPATAVTGR